MEGTEGKQGIEDLAIPGNFSRVPKNHAGDCGPTQKNDSYQKISMDIKKVWPATEKSGQAPKMLACKIQPDSLTEKSHRRNCGPTQRS